MSGQRDEIEFGDPRYFDCDCCGARTTSLTRFVTRNGAAFAVYYAQFTQGSEHNDVQVLMGFGPWAEDADPSQRTAIAMRLWNGDESFNVSLLDGPESGWDTEFLGRKLTREEALESRWKQEAFDLSDHIVECDRPIIDYLDSRS